MGKVTRAEWYRRVNAEWEGVKVPALTGDEAVRAVRKLYRFSMKSNWKGEIRLTSGNRRAIRVGTITTLADRMLRRPGKIRVIYVNPDAGWTRIVHVLSHWTDFWKGNGKHNATHAREEMRMIREVKRRGWLEGKLKPEPIVEKTAPAKAAVDPDAIKVARLEARLEAWERKQKRAERAIAKIRKSLRYYERKGLKVAS